MRNIYDMEDKIKAALFILAGLLFMMAGFSGCGTEGTNTPVTTAQMTCTQWVQNNETQCPLWTQECDNGGTKYDHFWRSCTGVEWWNRK